MQVRACRTLLIVALSLGFAATAAAETAQHDHDGLMSPGHLCMTVESPCPGPNCNPDDLYADPYAKGPRVVFINFDGVTLTKSEYSDNATTNTSVIVNSTTEVIPAFSRYDVGAGGYSRAQVIDYIVDEAHSYTNAFDIEFVTTRPSSGSYHMLVVGGTSGAVLNEGDNILGISLLDCGDAMASNVSFAFSGGGNMSLDGLVTTIVHEMAHAMGLSHVDHQYAIMNPYVVEGVTPSYRDQSISIPDGPGCGGANSQNSYQLMLSTIGPRGQDVSGPVITITSPTNGSFVDAGAQVTANITDASGVASAEMQVDGTTAQTLTSGPWTFTIPSNTPAGERQIKVRAYDTEGFSSFSAIIVNITSGEEDPCDGDDDCDGDWVCRGDICVPPGTPGALGDACASDSECASALCGDVGGEKLCTQACGGSIICPSGFECLGETACWPSGDDGGGGGGCMLSESSSRSSGSLPFLLLAGFAFAFAITRRRR